jgi:hypothetical protein
MTAAYDYDEAGGEAGWVIDGLRQRLEKLDAENKRLLDELTCCATQLFELRSAVRKLIGPVPGGE